jgi:hypothetical protein
MPNGIKITVARHNKINKIMILSLEARLKNNR